MRIRSVSKKSAEKRRAHLFPSTTIVVLILLAGAVGGFRTSARDSRWSPAIPGQPPNTVVTIQAGPQFDIKPGSCSNPVNPRSREALPVAIVGGNGFSVSEIDLSTIALTRSDDPARVYPVRASVEDVTGTRVGSPCACSEDVADGIDDLILNFETQDVVSALRLDADAGQHIELTIVGHTLPVREDGKLIYTFELSASPGVPPGTGSRGGSCTVTLDEFWGDVTADCSYRGLVGVAISAHLHDATSILLPLSVSGGMNGVVRGSGTLTSSQVQTVLDGLAFINIHTGSFPGGEVRGYVEGGSPFSASDCVRVLARRHRP
jgi:hypothetical protein